MGELSVRMPALSATMEDAELRTWLVAVGDEVRSGQPLAEVATDKVDMELESPYDGTVSELLTDEGTRVCLGDVVATLTSDEDDLLGDLDLGDPGVSETAAEPARGDTAPTIATDLGRGGRVRIPAAPPPLRKRAKQLGVDLAEVEATGARGQVTNADLAAYLESRDRAPAVETPEPVTRASGRRRAIRLATARAMSRSAMVPQFTIHRSIDVSVARERRGGRSWTTELARALAAALWRHPECNAVWDAGREEPVPLELVRVGIAVDTDDGLVVVGVDDPDGTEPDEADRRIKSAIERARTGRLTPEDSEGLSSTISNLGGFGIDRFNALLLPPQATILSVGRMVERPVVVDGRVRVQPRMDIGLTVDHRVADGADGARLLDAFAQRLEV